MHSMPSPSLSVPSSSALSRLQRERARRTVGTAAGEGTFVFLALLFLSFAGAYAASKYSSPQGYVTDIAGILGPSSRQSLEQQLSDFEKATSNEIAVLTTPSLQG